MTLPTQADAQPTLPAAWMRTFDPLRPADVPQVRGEAVNYLRSTRSDQGRPADDDALDNVALVISELITNVLKHVASPDRPAPAGVVLLLDGDDVLVVVSDQDSNGPCLNTTAPGTQEGGLGLGMVRALTNNRWGWHPLPVGKRVWALCALTQPNPQKATAS